MTKERKLNIGTRISSMILDHFILTFGIMVAIGAFLLLGFLIVGDPTESNLPLWLIIIPASIFLIIASTYFNKDAIHGKSPGKRVLGLIVVNNKSGQTASPIRAVIRNITIVFWPIEVIVTLFSPNRRIGDFIANTRIEIDDKKPEGKLNYGQLIIALLIGILYFILITLIEFMIYGINIFDW